MEDELNSALIEDESDEVEKTERVEREKFLSKMASLSDDPIGDIKWVYQALGAKDLVPEDAPSPGAWGLLQEIQETPASIKHFYSGPFGKILAMRVQKEEGEIHVDDGRKLFGIIERLLREPDDDAPVLTDVERRSRELAVSAAGAQSGI
jgi:hypothetical protein